MKSERCEPVKNKPEKTETKTAGPTSTQLERLAAIEAKLVDVALDECDPDGWTNAETAAEEARQLAEAGEVKDAKAILSGWKGQRYWEKKNANQTLALITRIVTYRQRLEEFAKGGKPLGDDEAKLEADMATAEKAVKKRLALVKKRAV